MKHQRGEVLLFCLLFLVVVAVAAAIHEVSTGHSPSGDQVEQQK